LKLETTAIQKVRNFQKAHAKTELARVKLRDLPVLMNAPAGVPPNSYGFCAVFTGGPGGLADLHAASVFPWGSNERKAHIALLFGIAFPTFISALKIGALFDDIKAFWAAPGDEAFFASGYVEVGTVNGKVTAGQRQLDLLLGFTDPVVSHVRQHSAARSGSAEEQGTPLVGWDELWWTFSHKLQQLKWRREDDPPVPSDQLSAMEGRLASLNHCAVPFWASKYVYWMAAYRRVRGDDAAFFRLLREVHDQLLNPSAEKRDGGAAEEPSPMDGGSRADMGG
jgi:hypothetical protein